MFTFILGRVGTLGDETTHSIHFGPDTTTMMKGLARVSMLLSKKKHTHTYVAKEDGIKKSIYS